MENTQTQLEKTNLALAELSQNVTTSDRKEAKARYSEVTIVKYLQGKGRDLDTAIDLLQFFRKRIENRDKIIA